MLVEEVKKALRECRLPGKCDACPLKENNDCMTLLKWDALNAIEELEERIAIMQESLDAYETARLMTWEEVVKVAEHNGKAPQDEQKYVWAEEKEWSLCEIARPEVYTEQIITLFTTGDECGWDCSVFDYNRIYRCWTNRPTKEQRKLKWD